MGDILHSEEHRPVKRMKLFAPAAELHQRSADASILKLSSHPMQHQPLPPQGQPFPPQIPFQPALQEQHRSAEYTYSAFSPTMDPTDESINSTSWSNSSAISSPAWTWPSPSAQAVSASCQFISSEANFDSSAVSAAMLTPPQYGVTGDIAITPTSSIPTEILAQSYDEFPLNPTDTAFLEQSASANTLFVSQAQPVPDNSDVGITPLPVTGVVGGHEEQILPNTSTLKSDVLQSPFRDCVGTFGQKKSQVFHRPVDGQVNGYIKFSWPIKSEKRRSNTRTSSTSSVRITELDDASETIDEAASPYGVTVIGPRAPPTARDSVPDLNNKYPDLVSRTKKTGYNAAIPTVSSLSSPVLSSVSTDFASYGAPRRIPSQYGYEAKMDKTDRRFWMFYIRNWCPGRSVLEDTNLWLKDFAQMQKSVGVRSAIQSLAGIYIYDYQPLESIRNRVNERFADAERRFAQLLNDPVTYRNETQANELIAIAVILCMQDIVLTERRLKKPFTPRWLQGFRHGEELLQATDHGSRFWKKSNVQASSLRISQSVIVGRAVILAQPMSPLPRPEEFDPQKEASRFGWLLYGTEKDIYQIHGGCGFSKKLLHIFSQVTYCAARLHQDAESPIVPTTAEYIHQEVLTMRQWSPESQSWDNAMSSPPVIDWVRQRPLKYLIDQNAIMTDVTAEAWRIAAILYLLCRVLRLPRNHPVVISNTGDLAKCISIMPTSGTQFTAQAPLCPVFLLGILACLPEHKVVCGKWFDEVLQTPVRSSVPPLYTSLKNIWGWIDTEFPLSMPPNTETAQPIHLRDAWWEKLVDKVQNQETELLCLT